MQELGCQLQAPAPRAGTLLRSLAALVLLAAAAWRVDGSQLLSRLAQLQPGYVALGVALAVPQLWLLALRWRGVAHALGQTLGAREALRDYALSLLLNQLLPLGVLGDGLRVLRQAQRGAAREPAWAGALHGVLLERGLGQLWLWSWALAVLPLWLGARGSSLLLCAVALPALAYGVGRERAPRASGQLALFTGAARQLARSGSLGSLLAISALILLSIAGQLCCALWSLGLSVPPLAAAKVFPLLLLAMSLPLSFFGFGPREAAVAALYGSLQLSRADGLAFSVAYGTLLLVSSLPCLGLALWLVREERP